MQVNQDWDIKPRCVVCAMCQGPFIDQQTYVSQLVFGGEGYARRDYCGACWAKVGARVASGPSSEKPGALPAPNPAEDLPQLPSEQPLDGMASAGERREVTVSIWKAMFHLPPPPPAEPLKKETAETLLRSLISKNEPIHKNVIFILAVMLERRRLLVERDLQTREDGSTIRVYEHRQTGEVILVTDPHLDLNRLGQVQEEVLAMLGNKPEPTEGTATPESVQPSGSNLCSQAPAEG